MQALTAVNAMLASIAQMPVNTVESRNPYSIAAVAVLNRLNTEVQELGWWFNTNTNVQLQPNSENYIVLPQNTLKVSDLHNRMNFVIRGGRLYNPLSNTSKFTETFLVDIVVELPFDTLPEVAAQAITRKSVLQFFTDRDGDQAKLQQLNNESLLSWSRLTNEGLYQRGVSMSLSPEFQRFTGRLGGSKTGMAVRTLSRVQRWGL